MANFATVKELHEELLDKAVRERQVLLRDDKERKKFKARLEDIIAKMEAVSANLSHLDEYEWLSAAVTKWRRVSADVLDSPLKVKLREPSSAMTPAAVPRNDWSEREFENWLEGRANEIYKDRVLTRYYNRSIADILKDSQFGQSRPGEDTLDWRRARSRLGCATLYGEFQFAEFKPETYHFLQAGCWLSEIKQTAAYFYWLIRRGGWDDGQGKDDWYKACQDIYGNMMAEENKASIVQFENVSRYLEKNYLRAGKKEDELDPKNAHGLIAAKAERLWEVTGRKAEANWADAETYCKSYYEHIIPAVTTAEDGHVRKVVEALQLRAGQPADPLREQIIDCFEVCIAAFFLNPRVARRVLHAVPAEAAHDGSRNHAPANHAG